MCASCPTYLNNKTLNFVVFNFAIYNLLVFHSLFLLDRYISDTLPTQVTHKYIECLKKTPYHCPRIRWYKITNIRHLYRGSVSHFPVNVFVNIQVSWVEQKWCVSSGAEGEVGHAEAEHNRILVAMHTDLITMQRSSLRHCDEYILYKH
jgi:hypothetical protein